MCVGRKNATVTADSTRSPELVDAPSSPTDVAAFLPRLAAALRGGAPLLPLPTSAQERERLLEVAAGVTVGDDIALVVPTSGSTGAPRLALLSAAALTASADATQEALGGAGRWLLALPTSHIAGLQVLVRSLRSGLAPAVVDTTSAFTVEAFVDAVRSLDIAAAEQPHYTSLVPTQLQRLLDSGEGVQSLWELDAVLVGGAALSGTLLHRARDAGVTVVRSYGMTETCGGCVYDGVPLKGVDVGVDNVGRVRLSGPMLFSGYADGSTEVHGGWFTTSDIGHLDAAGLLHIDGRIDNVITTGGVKVRPESVEHVVLSVPGVSAVIVVGVADEQWGERVVALVCAATPIDLDAVRSVTRSALPPEWTPRDVVTLESLPMLASGKPDRAAARHLAAVLAR